MFYRLLISKPFSSKPKTYKVNKEVRILLMRFQLIRNIRFQKVISQSTILFDKKLANYRWMVLALCWNAHT